jgi:hypothetical protein
VREVALPPGARALSTLARVDYEDAFRVEVGSARDRTAAEWARAIVEGAPASLRHGLRRGWSALGYRLGPTRSERFVLGWEVRRSTPDFVLLGATSRLGMPAELLLKRQQQALLFATFVQKQNPLARIVWAAVEPGHRPVVRYVLEQAAARVRAERGV